MAKREFKGAPQQAGQIRQLLAERANAEVYGQTDRIAAVDKQLAELGFVRDEDTPAVSRSSAPAERSAPQDKTEKAAPDKAVPATPPASRAPRKSTG